MPCERLRGDPHVGQPAASLSATSSLARRLKQQRAAHLDSSASEIGSIRPSEAQRLARRAGHNQVESLVAADVAHHLAGWNARCILGCLGQVGLDCSALASASVYHSETDAQPWRPTPTPRP